MTRRSPRSKRPSASRKPSRVAVSRRPAVGAREPAEPAPGAGPAAASPPPRRPTVVALGASAGGLAAFERFLHLMPPGGNLAFLLVSHLDPSQKSLLPSLLAPHTKLSVTAATSGAVVEPDHVYVIPPNTYMTLEAGVIRLEPIQEPRGARFPIDVLLRSLAEDQAENAVAVILSGTGADGTDGLRAIKDNGGTVLVQDPQTVEYAGMPESAIATGVVDFVVPVEQMPDILLGYARHAYTNAPGEPVAEIPTDLRSIFSVLKAHGDDLDYQSYKPGTLTRRIHRRMGLARIDSIKEYVARLRTDPEELERLRKDLIITVTHFFRDPEAWKALNETVIPALFKDREEDAPIRVWVPGCSTGEEAYSIAMLLLDHKRSIHSTRPIQIFATDITAGVLDVARAALYDKSSVAHIPPERLKRYFQQEGPSAFRATKELREVVAFAVHNLLTDPPFSRMDLVSCRNVLIYFQPQAQQKVISLFEFGLKHDAYLFLGASESIASHEPEFESVSKKWRIYRHKGPTRGAAGRVPLAITAFAAQERPTRAMGSARGAKPEAAGLDEAAERWLVERYAPAAAIVDSRYDILHIHGALGSYLELPRGKPTLNLLTMAPADLRGKLRVEVQRTRAGKEARELIVQYQNPDKTTRQVRIVVAPFDLTSSDEPLCIVTFEPAPQEGAPKRRHKQATLKEESAIRLLEAELAATKGDLHGTIESLETANEELRASNEEIMSMNEEFRSTNEELETSKEELQSLNEELSTVNAQLREKVQALETVTNDLTNLFATTNVPTLFLDTHLHIRRFTDAGKAVFNLLPTDLGRPMSDISLKVHDETLLHDVQDVLHSLAPAEKQVQTAAGRRFLRRIRPYRTSDNRIDGAVVTFTDIEGVLSAEDLARSAGRYAEEIVETVREPLLGLDANLHVLSANRAYCEKFHTTTKDTIGRSIFSLSEGIWNLPAMRGRIERAIREKVDMRNVEVEVENERLGHRTMLLNTRRFPVKDGEERILLALDDVTEAKHARDLVAAHARETEAANRRLGESIDAFSRVVGHDLKEPARAVESLLSVLQEDHAALLPPEGKKLVADARAANERLSRLITGLLALSRASRIEAQDLGPVGIADSLASEVCRTRYEALLAERHATIDPPQPDVLVHATREILCQVLGNLILNAIKHNPAPAPRVRIRAGPAKDAGMIEVVIEDNGPGFSPDLVHGFENMSATTRGFGLLIARRAVENLGGRMWLGRTDAGGGAVHFTVRTAE